MKRTVITLLTALLAVTSVCGLAGCGSKESSKSTDASSSAQSSAASDASSKASTAAISAEDAVFTYNGVNVELNGDAAAAVAALGEPNDVSSQLSCHGEGEDKTYTYDNFVLNTYPLNGEERVLEIVVKSADIPTSKGVKVGDTAETVTAAYGNGFREIGTYYAYDAGDGKSLQFLMENGTVKEIDYYYDV